MQIRQAEFNVQGSKANFNQSKINFLPNINANLGDGFSFGRSQSREGVYVDENSNSANASLNLDLMLFQGLRNINELHAKKYAFLASVEDREKIKKDITLNVISYYLNVLIQKELLNIAIGQIALTDSMEKHLLLLVASGKEAEVKVYEIRAQRATEQYNLTESEMNVRLAMLDLAQILDVKETAGFDVENPYRDLDITTTLVPDINFESAVAGLPDVKAEEMRLHSARKNLSIAKSYHYPTLSFNAFTSTGYYYMQDIMNAPFAEQALNNLRNYVGVSLSIPIFNRLTVWTGVRTSKLQMQQQELQLEEAKKTLFKDIQRASLNVSVAQKRYLAADGSVEANSEAYRYIEERYKSGRATLLELQQAKTNLEKSLSERIRAKYEFVFGVKILELYGR